MWGRRRAADPQAVAAAQARLAALRGQLAHAPPPEGHPTDPPVSEGGDEARPGPFEFTMQPAAPPGRHAAALSMRQRLLARLCDLLPTAVPGRFGVASQHVSVVAVLLAVCLVAGSWLFLRSRPEPVESVPRARLGTEVEPTVPTATPPTGTAAPAGTTPQPTPSMLVVDVAGKVRRPGVVELPAGSRVVDALRAAGGALPHVNLATLNLARMLVDGEQILVGAPAVAGSPPPSASTGASSTAPAGLVNINTASQEQLEELPGVGPVTALAILTWREENGAFSSVDELLEVSGIGDVTLEDLRPYVTV